MNLLFSCIGQRGYIAKYFRDHLSDLDRIIGTSNTKWTPGFRECDAGFLLPSYEDESAYAKALINLCEQQRIDAILSFMDEDVVILSRIRGDLENLGIRLMHPTQNVAETCLDKWRSYEFFKKSRLQTALTFLEIDEVLDAIVQKEISFPVIIKPRFGFGSKNTFIARNEKELDVFFHYQSDMIIQEKLGGEEYNLDLLCDFESVPLSIVPWRKYRSTLGETEQSMTVERQDLIDFGFTLVKALEHIGPMDVDLFVSKNSIKILEMNPRFGGGYPVSQLAGADFPGLIIRLIQGEKVEPQIGRYNRMVVMLKEIVPFGGDANTFFDKDLKLS